MPETNREKWEVAAEALDAELANVTGPKDRLLAIKLAMLRLHGDAWQEGIEEGRDCAMRAIDKSLTRKVA